MTSIPTKQSMRPRARLIHTLGRDLISSEKVALVELVKNAYDADASTVLIRFEGPLKSGSGAVEVWDDGHGMDADTVTGTWFDIATAHRKKDSRTRYRGRRVLGEKGIGRLAAARLGRRMSLTTREAENDEVVLTIDWSAFEDDDKFLDEVEIDWSSRRPTVFSLEPDDLGIDDTPTSLTKLQRGHGTRIRVEQLATEWGRKELEDLSSSLARLLPPAAAEEFAELDFRIILDIPEPFEDLAGPVSSPEELEKSHYRIKAIVDHLGYAVLEYEGPDGQAENFELALNSDPLNCGPLEVDLRVWDRDTASLRDLLPESSVRSVRQMLSDASGVSVYRDSFRVLPYGERGDDWLSMDARRVQNPTLRLSNNQVLGYVFISGDQNPSLRDQSNREGLMEGQGFDDLKLAVTAILEQVEIRRYKSRRPEKEKSTSKGLFSKFDLHTVRRVIDERYPQDKVLQEALKSSNNSVAAGIKDVEEIVARYSRLATMGMLIDRVVHDGRTAVARLINLERFALRDFAKTSFTDQEKLEIARTTFEASKSQVDLLRTVFRKIEPFGGRKRGRSTETSMSSLVQDAFAVVEAEASSKSIELRYQSNDFSVRADPSEVQQVLVNLLLNAIYWTAKAPSADPASVEVLAQREEDGSVLILVCDSGPGVNPDVADLIFDPYFSERPDGFGLGLGIVGHIVESDYDGSLELVDQGSRTGATFRVILRGKA